MKHFIIAKFKDRADTENLYPEIKELFSETLEIPGVESFIIHKSNSTRENRYSIMIEMNLSAEGRLLHLTQTASSFLNYLTHRKTIMKLFI